MVNIQNMLHVRTLVSVTTQSTTVTDTKMFLLVSVTYSVASKHYWSFRHGPGLPCDLVSVLLLKSHSVLCAGWYCDRCIKSSG